MDAPSACSGVRRCRFAFAMTIYTTKPMVKCALIKFWEGEYIYKKLFILNIILVMFLSEIVYSNDYEYRAYNFEDGTLSLDWLPESGNWAVSNDSCKINKLSLTTGEISCPYFANISIKNIYGPAYLQFDWKISGAKTLMEFYIDNRSEPAAICRSYYWISNNIYIPDGLHTIKWILRFNKTNDQCIAGSKGSGWLCNVILPISNISIRNTHVKNTSDSQLIHRNFHNYVEENNSVDPRNHVEETNSFDLRNYSEDYEEETDL